MRCRPTAAGAFVALASCVTKLNYPVVDWTSAKGSLARLIFSKMSSPFAVHLYGRGFSLCVARWHDLARQFGNAVEAALPDRGGEVGEEPIDQIEPGTRGRRDVHPGRGCRASLRRDLAVLVCGVVVTRAEYFERIDADVLSAFD